MTENITPFAIECRRLRAKRGLLMGDQAEALKVSVSYVSAIELGSRPIPEGYISRFSNWLELSANERQIIEEAASANTNVIKFRPKDSTRAQLAYGIAKRLNELTPNEIRKLRNLIEGNQHADG